ncbi:energy transducer TonB [Chryseobacterium taeanense]|uniref:energy transducer TonB n=1 Tax=Chryseobacterium taeanense TaxID=311334 RepID=UPI000B7D1E07|nr:energy transducer TonB [Chryseobacterium taeanense]
MKILTFCCILLFSFGLAQEQSLQTTQLNELLIVEKNGRLRMDAEKPASFPLGSTEFTNKLSKNFRSRKVISTADIESCEIIFIIDKDGNMTDIKTLGTNQSFNDEAMRAISKITQKWIPAEMNGEKVRYKFRVPITIRFNKK